MRRLAPWLVVVAVLALDRASKLAVMARLDPGESIALFPGLALTHVHNTGIAFSLFAGGGALSRAVLHLVIFAAVVLIAWMLVRDGSTSPVLGGALGLILGGALGNLLDRLLYGWVVDFIHVWVLVEHRVRSWPDFNLADSAISVGAALLILHEVLSWRRRHERREPAGAEGATGAPGAD